MRLQHDFYVILVIGLLKYMFLTKYTSISAIKKAMAIDPAAGCDIPELLIWQYSCACSNG